MPNEWAEQAKCKNLDQDIFFDTKQALSRNMAKKICDKCLVARECLDHALINHIEFGIWGGKTPRERGVTYHSGRASGVPRAK